MSVYRCNDCGELTITDDEVPVEQCEHCGSTRMACNHPSGQFDKARQSFVCSWCGQEYGNDKTFARLRDFAKTGPVPELRDLIDCTDH